MANQPKLPLQQVQKDPAELERCQKDPVYFYNKYIRREGEEVLTAEKYKAHVEAVEKYRNAAGVLKGRTGREYPIIPIRDEAEGATAEMFEAAKPKENLDIKGEAIVYGTAGEMPIAKLPDYGTDGYDPKTGTWFWQAELNKNKDDDSTDDLYRG